MSRVLRYLQIPREYACELGGVYWSPAHDVLLLPEGPESEGGVSTFAFNAEVLAFLEGFAAQRPLIHFAHALHLLRLLRHPSPRHDFGPLRDAYRRAGGPPRNAGAFCAWLCRDVPPVPDPPSLEELADWWAVRWVAPHPPPLEPAADEPPVHPEVFEAFVACALEKYSFDDLVHWLRYGQAPAGETGEQVARPLEGVTPRSLDGVFAELGRRERLAGALHLVDQLVGALTIPPRRLSPPELPLGGYCDVTTRGQPEQVLVSQFALDELEFVRRHAEHELLYYRREEPQARVREELVALLDQGVRTWGPVRLALAAAVFALGRKARRRGAPFRVAATSAGGAVVDPLKAAPETLAEMLEASDLTPHPGEALEKVLREKNDDPRDVVLLTHPRNLGEEGVLSAARRLRPPVRLFALAVDERGAAQLCELRHGGAVPLSRFRVDLGRPGSAPAPRPDPHGAWRGDVEPIGFPFLFGVGHPGPLKFDFDAAGEWLLAATPEGMLHLTRTDRSSAQVLPRGMFGGQLLTRVEAVLGVAGGFVVAGQVMGSFVAVHYDLGARVVRAYGFAADAYALKEGAAWWYLRRRHTLLVSVPAEREVRGVQLTTGRQEVPEAARARPQIRPRVTGGASVRWCITLAPQDGGGPPEASPWPWMYFVPAEGSIELHQAVPGWQAFTPLADGRPLLREHMPLRAVCHAHTLAAVFRERDGAVRLYLFRGPGGVPQGHYTLADPRHECALSRDGKLLAFQRGPGEVVVHNTLGGSPLCVVPAGRFHHDVEVVLGDRWLTLGVGGWTRHLVRWDEGRLVHRTLLPRTRKRQAAPDLVRSTPSPTGVAVRPGPLPGWVTYDPKRFVGDAWGKLVAVVDRFGEVFLFERTGELVAGFFMLRGGLGAWLPDGTCYGPESLVGRRAAPDAAERIGQALLSAGRRGEGVAP